MMPGWSLLPLSYRRSSGAPRLCAAIVDRLTYDAHIIQTGTGSYRLRVTAARRRGGTPAPEVSRDA